jgi:transcription antitermination factor NusB
MRKRTHARELAMQLLYQRDVCAAPSLEGIDALIETLGGDPEVAAFARELLAGTWEHRPQIDRAIEGVARNWELKRMAAVDRNILRLAAYELLYRDDIPPLVSINEAIEMAKKYSTRNSGPFVNGILDNIRLKAVPVAPSGPPAHHA